MLGTVLRYEWLRIFRSVRGALVLVALLTGAFAAWEGAAWKGFQERALAKAASLEESQRGRHLADAIAADTGLAGLAPVPLGSPLHGMSLYWTRRYARLPPEPLAALAVGQSDLEPYYAVFNGVEPNVLLFPEEIRNPLSLLHGRWDARFLVVLLLPLLILALGFDLAAEERETGTLRLLGAGARSLPRYFFLRAAVHLTLVAVPGLGSFLLLLAILDPGALAAWRGLLLFGLATLAYLAFWSSLCLGVNALRRGAGFNLAALILLWAALAFLVPTGLERLAGLAHPLPSREEQALSLRALEDRSSRMREEGVSRFRKERPELFDTARVRGRPAAHLEWYPGFLAEQAVLDRARDSLESQILRARADREAWSAGLRRLAPTLAMEDFILRLAGRDPSTLRRFSRRLEEYRSGIREAIWPRLIQGRAFSAQEIATLPRWRATDADARPSYPIGTLAAVVLPTLALSAISWMHLRRPG